MKFTINLPEGLKFTLKGQKATFHYTYQVITLQMRTTKNFGAWKQGVLVRLEGWHVLRAWQLGSTERRRSRNPVVATAACA